MAPATHHVLLAVALLGALPGCGTMAFLQDAEVLPTGKNRVGFGIYAGGIGNDGLYQGANTFFWTRHGVAADRLEIRTRITPWPVGASLGLKAALVGEPDALGLQVAASVDAGAYVFPWDLWTGSAFSDSGQSTDDTCGDHGCGSSDRDPAYTVVEGALALGGRTSRDMTVWFTPRVAHATSLGTDDEQTLVAASVGVSGGRTWLVALELTPAYDIASQEMVWYLAIGLEFPLGPR